jgi:hypothetical protein
MAALCRVFSQAELEICTEDRPPQPSGMTLNSLAIGSPCAGGARSPRDSLLGRQRSRKSLFTKSHLCGAVL